MTAPVDQYKVGKTARELLDELRRQGVNLYVTDDGHLRYEMPLGAATLEQMHLLRALKAEILRLIETTCADCGRTLGKVCCELLDGRRMCGECMVGR